MRCLSLFPADNAKSSPEMLNLELSLAPPPAPPSLSLENFSSDPPEPSLELWLWPAERKADPSASPSGVDTPPPAPPSEGERRWREWEEKVAALTNGTATAARRVLEKKLYATDVSPTHCRLLLTENLDGGDGGGRRKGPRVLLETLTAAEKAEAAREGGGLPVLLVDRRGLEYPSARLKLWRSSDSYVLIGKWAELVRRNELDPGDVIDIYLFRYDGGVGLVVCSRVSAGEEERRRRDGSEERVRRREEKAEGMRWHKRRRIS